MITSLSNSKIFDYSVANEELLVDLFYRNDKIIITDNPMRRNDLMKRNMNLIEQIIAYKVARARKDAKTVEHCIDEILILLTVPEINVSELVTFWATLDVSFSTYQNLSDEKKREFLRSAIDAYIDTRHNLYSVHGYTATTLQVRQDSFAHKASGSNALRKLEQLFSRYKFSRATGTVKDFIKSEKEYIFPDDSDSATFDQLLALKKLSFDWGRHYQGKRPDAAFTFKGHLFLLEHKHKKEGGGGQGGQLTEIISFIQSKESNRSVHYVSFLDGVYFNELVSVTSKRSKVYRQLQDIKRALKEHPRNYFLNTAGFGRLLLGK